MPTEKSDLLQGTLDMLILKIVALGPVHGYGISQRIRQISKEVLQVQQGSLYPARQRLQKRGWLAAEWGQSDNPGSRFLASLGMTEGCHDLVEFLVSQERPRRATRFRTSLSHRRTGRREHRRGHVAARGAQTSPARIRRPRTNQGRTARGLSRQNR